MQRVCRYSAILLSLFLTQCASNPLQKEYVVQAPNIPAVPSDVDRCAEDPTSRPAKLTASEANRLWNQDRASLVKVNSCFYRLICQYHDVRKEIGQVETERVCDRISDNVLVPPPPAPAVRKSLRKRSK